MKNRSLSTALAISALIATACGDATQEQSPGEVLARDSSLASELKQSDTSAFAEAADVAMAFDPDSALPPAGTTTPATPAATPRAAPAPPSIAATTPRSSPVPMRVNPPAAVPATRAPMRPTPATIHPEPLPPRPLPARPSTSAAPARGASMAGNTDPRATEILAKVPGAALPPVAEAELVSAGRNDAPCSSPAAADQRRCLMIHLARSDVALDRTYQALITDMKREAGAAAGAKEPESVQQLRAAQRAWLVYRDTECRRRNRGKEGPLWAPVRAECLGEFSGNRAAELARALRERQGP